MKIIRLLPLFFALFSLAIPVSAATPDERLVGTWQEYSPSSNVIQFFNDHTVRLYLTKEEGEQSAPPAHYIGGTWSIKKVSGKYILHMHMSAGGNSMDRNLELVFDNAEMIMVDDDDDGAETRHRRLKGRLPAIYSW